MISVYKNGGSEIVQKEAIYKFQGQTIIIIYRHFLTVWKKTYTSSLREDTLKGKIIKINLSDKTGKTDRAFNLVCFF